mgnify:CR=1 FL=1
MNNDKLFNTHLDIYQSIARLELIESITAFEDVFAQEHELFNTHLDIYQSTQGTTP